MRTPSKLMAVSLLTVIGCLAGSAMQSAQAVAPDSSECGGDVTVNGTIGGGGVYIDPFLGAGTTVSGSLTLNRIAAASGGGKTQDYAFYLVPNVTLPGGSHVYYNGVDILNPNPSGTPTSLPPPSGSSLNLSGGTIEAYSGSTPSGYLVVGFSGASQPDTQIVNNIQFTLGTLGGLDAGSTTVYFQVYYVCKATGGYTAVTSPKAGDPHAITLTVNTLSALQASYQGTALDFGDITNAPANTTTVTGSGAGSGIRFASNAPVGVTLASSNGNSFLLTPGDVASSAGSSNAVKYRVSFLGNTAGYTSGVKTNYPNNIICPKVGISGIYLPITATLDEGGAGKVASSNYLNNLTITFTPEAAATGVSGTCNTSP